MVISDITIYGGTMKLHKQTVQEEHIDHKKTGREAREERKRSGKTQRFVAEKMGVTPVYLCELEKGRRKWTAEFEKAFNAAIE